MELKDAINVTKEYLAKGGSIENPLHGVESGVGRFYRLSRGMIGNPLHGVESLLLEFATEC